MLPTTPQAVEEEWQDPERGNVYGADTRTYARVPPGAETHHM